MENHSGNIYVYIRAMPPSNARRRWMRDTSALEQTCLLPLRTLKVVQYTSLQQLLSSLPGFLFFSQSKARHFRTIRTCPHQHLQKIDGRLPFWKHGQNNCYQKQLSKIALRLLSLEAAFRTLSSGVTPTIWNSDPGCSTTKSGEYSGRFTGSFRWILY